MRTAVALLAPTMLLAGAAPALAGSDNALTAAGRLTACDSLGDRPSHGEIRACVDAARRFAEAHRAVIEKARIQIRAHRPEIEAAMRAGRDNAMAVREAEQALQASRDAIDEALRELHETEGLRAAAPDQATPPTQLPRAAPSK